MEIMDFLDVLTSISGDKIDVIPPNIGGRLNERVKRVNRTEEVVGSSPTRSTHTPYGSNTLNAAAKIDQYIFDAA